MPKKTPAVGELVETFVGKGSKSNCAKSFYELLKQSGESFLIAKFSLNDKENVNTLTNCSPTVASR